MSRFLTDPDCIRQREFVNIPAWHDAGYLGEGLTAFCDDSSKNSHDIKVSNIVKAILPKARVFTGKIGFRSANNEIVECNITCNETGERLPFDDFVKKYNASLFNNSTDGGQGERVLPKAIYMREKIKEHNLIFCGAAGNAYGQPTTQSYNGACIVVSSCRLDNGDPVWSRKAVGDNIDFVMFSGFESGTSFSSPFLLGLAGLLRSKYPNITQEEVYQYFKNHSLNLGDKNKYGWGLPIMGKPRTVITMYPDKNYMSVDGRTVKLDQAPTIVKETGRTLVPIRAVAEAFGAEVEWNSKTRTITIVR